MQIVDDATTTTNHHKSVVAIVGDKTLVRKIHSRQIETTTFRIYQPIDNKKEQVIKVYHENNNQLIIVS